MINAQNGPSDCGHDCQCVAGACRPLGGSTRHVNRFDAKESDTIPKSARA